ERLRPWHRGLSLMVQAGVAGLANLAAISLRYDGVPPPRDMEVLLPALPLLVLIRCAWFRAFKLDRDLWQFVGVRELAAIASAVLFGSMTFWLVLVASGVGGDYSRALLALDGLLCTVA